MKEKQVKASISNRIIQFALATEVTNFHGVLQMKVALNQYTLITLGVKIITYKFRHTLDYVSIFMQPFYGIFLCV